MAANLAHKLIRAHLVEGELSPGSTIGVKFEHTLTQDATGTLVMLILEALETERVKTETSVQYIDHNLLQKDHKNADEHQYLLQASKKLGVWYSRAGNGISHPLHMQYFSIPGQSLIGSDSHTCANGCMGMLAIGAGAADVAMAMAGKTVFMPMPDIWGIELSGRLPDWVSAKDVILEMLRRHGVEGGMGRIIEYYGPGLGSLSAMDRHVIANMGAELGATTSVFPSDENTKRYLGSVCRQQDWIEWKADKNCLYEHNDSIDLSSLQPLIAKPSSPGNVVTVASVAGEPIQQAYIGSSANPGYRDFAVVAEILKHKLIPEHVSLDINPSTRDILRQLIDDGHLSSLIAAGARLHQVGCNGCVGMGQAAASGANSLRTTPRNFRGRSGSSVDKVWLCSPETAAASALKGRICDPRELDMTYPRFDIPRTCDLSLALMTRPAALADKIDEIHRPDLPILPTSVPVTDNLYVPVILKLGDDLSTDEILSVGTEVLSYQSDLPKIADLLFQAVSDSYPEDARRCKTGYGHAIIAGHNYGQGSSRGHAAMAPRYLGLQVVIALSFARIHFQNLINFGVLPLTFVQQADYKSLQKNHVLNLRGIHRALAEASTLDAYIEGSDTAIPLQISLSQQQRSIVLAGGVVAWAKKQTETKHEH